MMRIIVELQKTHAPHCYMTCKKWLEMYGFHLTDLGHVGISDKFYFDKITPCDIVVYGTSQKVKTDDIILYAHFLNEHNLSFIHLKMKRMSADGTVDAESDIQKHLTVPRNNIIGKVLRVIPFNDPEWHEIVMEMVNIPWLEDKLHKAIKHYSNPKHSDMEKVNEINRRLQILGKIP